MTTIYVVYADLTQKLVVLYVEGLTVRGCCDVTMRSHFDALWVCASRVDAIDCLQPRNLALIRA